MLLVFAGLAYSELRTAASSAMPPSMDEMPLTKIVGPELFEKQNVPVKPAELASTVFNRIYVIGAASLGLLAIGSLLLFVKRSSQSQLAQRESTDSTPSSLP